MTRRFQFSLPCLLLAVAMLATLAPWLVTLGSVGFVVAFPVVVAALWGIYRRDAIFLGTCLFVAATCLILAASRDY
ncbi:MAG TPA: hypothetical protein VHC22_28335 [Pirellulales bacterium]|nr:hypothetical protein [Pirellulales bacterium]